MLIYRGLFNSADSIKGRIGKGGGDWLVLNWKECRKG